MPDEFFIHPTAEVSEGATIGSGTFVWHQAQVRAGARVGRRCVLGKGVYVDAGVVLGDGCRVQNYACVYAPAELGQGVFVGPHVVFTNDLYPRALMPDETERRGDAWSPGKIVVEDAASIGAGAVIRTNVRIGQWALVAAGSVVIADVPPYTLVAGVPAKEVGKVCRCGKRIASKCIDCGMSDSDVASPSRPWRI
jgi:acetyltransferase-like isoleucine patch superfamily enzyme